MSGRALSQEIYNAELDSSGTTCDSVDNRINDGQSAIQLQVTTDNMQQEKNDENKYRESVSQTQHIWYGAGIFEMYGFMYILIYLTNNIPPVLKKKKSTFR